MAVELTAEEQKQAGGSTAEYALSLAQRRRQAVAGNNGQRPVREPQRATGLVLPPDAREFAQAAASQVTQQRQVEANATAEANAARGSAPQPDASTGTPTRGSQPSSPAPAPIRDSRPDRPAIAPVRGSRPSKSAIAPVRGRQPGRPAPNSIRNS